MKEKKTIRIIKTWWPTALVTCAVLWLTLAPHPLPDEADVPLFEHADKVVHALMMGGLAATAMFDVWRRTRSITKKQILMTGIIVAIFSCADEWAQSLTGRSTDPLDALADLTGVVIACAIFPTKTRL